MSQISTSSDSVTYFFPGMAASEVMFYHYRDLPFSCKFFNWDEPKKGESMHEYAKRYISKMDLSKKVNLVGVSFGGIVVSEISKQIPVDNMVIISSMPSEYSIPRSIRLMRFIPLHFLMPNRMPPKIPRKLMANIFGINKEADLDYFIEMISKFNIKTLKWSIHQLINWSHKEIDPKLIHIIGDRDKLMKPGSCENEYVVRGGSHYMVVNRASEVKSLLKEILSTNASRSDQV